MARIIVDSLSKGHEVLAAEFLKALCVLHDSGFELCSGTKLTSRYAVLVVEDSAVGPAIDRLISANLKVTRETH